MIQRIQSIFLTLAAIGFLGTFKFPFATSDTPIPVMLQDQVYNIHDNIILTILAVTGALGALATLFLFKNRELQVKASYLVIILSILLPLLAFLLIYNEGTAMVEGAQIDDAAGLYLALLNWLWSGLSTYFIKKDQALVESMDRLR